jgi:hypothetical protein
MVRVLALEMETYPVTQLHLGQRFGYRAAPVITTPLRYQGLMEWGYRRALAEVYSDGSSRRYRNIISPRSRAHSQCGRCGHMRCRIQCRAEAAQQKDTCACVSSYPPPRHLDI